MGQQNDAWSGHIESMRFMQPTLDEAEKVIYEGRDLNHYGLIGLGEQIDKLRTETGADPANSKIKRDLDRLENIYKQLEAHRRIVEVMKKIGLEINDIGITCVGSNFHGVDLFLIRGEEFVRGADSPESLVKKIVDELSSLPTPECYRYSIGEMNRMRRGHKVQPSKTHEEARLHYIAVLLSEFRDYVLEELVVYPYVSDLWNQIRTNKIAASDVLGLLEPVHAWRSGYEKEDLFEDCVAFAAERLAAKIEEENKD